MQKFNLYLVSQDINNNYDTYDSMIVSAPDEASARNIHPGGKWDDSDYLVISWVMTSEKDKLKIEKIGTSDIQETKVILASFNAG